jgi:hypothetical protein
MCNCLAMFIVGRCFGIDFVMSLIHIKSLELT